MDQGMRRLVSVVTLAGALMACGAASSGADSSGADSSGGSLSPFDGTWACTVNGQGPPVTLKTSPSTNCKKLETVTYDASVYEAYWLTCVDDISGNAGTPSDCTETITGGSLSVSDDGNTLTISETGGELPDASGIRSFHATCMRTAPSQVQCGPDGSAILETPDATPDATTGDDAESTQPLPECYIAADCGGTCARCQYGRCIYCPIGDLGICTC